MNERRVSGSFVGRRFAAGVILVALCPGCRAGLQAPPRFVAGPNSPVPAGSGPTRPILADFNGDGRPDIVVCCGNPTPPKNVGILVLLNDGAARFVAVPGGRIDAGQPVDSLAVADFNGDRHADVAAVGHDSYQVHVFLGDGKGGLGRAPAGPFAAHSGPKAHTHAVAAADVNGDRQPDVLTTNADDNAISVLLNDGRARFTPAPGSPFRALRHPYSSLAVRDFNGDGHLDVAAPLLQSGEIGVYLGDGSGRFTPAPGAPYRVAARPGFVHADDLNGDGKPDILATHDDVGIVDLLLNEGGGRFRFAPGSPVRLREAVWEVTTADFDGDGDRDAVLNAASSRSLVLLLGDGRGGLDRADQANLPVGQSPNHVATADLDGDGRTDIVSSNFDSGDLTVLLRR